MNEKTFKHEMIKAKTFHDLGERAEYWAGYMRGLRRRYHGEKFGTEEEHQIWMTADGDETRRDRSQGYRDGFLGIETKTLTIRLPADLWRRMKMMQIDGKIKSINQAVSDGLEIIAKEKG